MTEVPLIDVGAQYPTKILVTDSSGAATNASTQTLVITLPDQTTATASIVNTTTGAYYAAYTTTQEGLHRAAWITTAPATAFVDWFEAVAVRSILSMAAARRHLNLTATTDDDELRGHMVTATEVVERFVGPCTVRTVTEEITSGMHELVVSQHPILSVTSVTSVWSASDTWATADLKVNTESGIIRRADRCAFVGGPWMVVYRAGRAVVPHTYVQAAKEMLRHLWETQRGGQSGGPRVAGADDQVFVPGLGYSIPRRVLELLAGDRVPPVG